MKGPTDWLAANDDPKARGATPERAWIRGRGETWRRPASPAEPGGPGPREAARIRHPLVTASRVAGSGVYTASGRRLGRVVELGLDEASGDVAFVVVASGGFLGFGERRARLPWSALSYQPHRRAYVVDLPDPEVDALTAVRARPVFERATDRGGWAAGA